MVPYRPRTRKTERPCSIEKSESKIIELCGTTLLPWTGNIAAHDCLPGGMSVLPEHSRCWPSGASFEATGFGELPFVWRSRSGSVLLRWGRSEALSVEDPKRRFFSHRKKRRDAIYPRPAEVLSRAASPTELAADLIVPGGNRGRSDCRLLRAPDLFQTAGGSTELSGAFRFPQAGCCFPPGRALQTARASKRSKGTVRGYEPAGFLRAGRLCDLPSRKDRDVLRCQLTDARFRHQTNQQAPPPG